MVPLNELIYGLVSEVAGKEVIPLIDLLWGKSDISEFKLADKLKITVNLVRNMLYKLNSYNLVSFTRKKDKKKGWYIYYWTFDLIKALNTLTSFKNKKIKLLEEKLSQKQIENYFSCPNKCIILKYNAAMENEFKCPECGDILEKLDMKKQVVQIKKQINILRDELKDTKIYLQEEEEKILKKKVRLEKKLIKKKIKKVKKKPKKKVKKLNKKIKKVKKKPKKKIKKKKNILRRMRLLK